MSTSTVRTSTTGTVPAAGDRTGLVPSPAEVPRHVPPQHRLSFAGLLRSEWIKFFSVRSVVVTMGVAVTCVVGLSALLAAVGVWSAGGGDISGARDATGTAMTTSMLGAELATLIAAALGVITITGEYATGMIRTSLTAVPGRLPLLAAKAVVVAAAVTLVLGAAVFAAFFVGQAVYATRDGDVALSAPHVLRVLIGHIAVLAGVAVAGVGLGAFLRSTPAAICTLLALLFIVPVALLTLPDFPGKDLLTDHHFAATTLALTSTARTGLAAVLAAVPFLLWIAALLGLGALALRRRDV